MIWLLSFFFLVDATTPWLYRGGFLVMALLALPLIVAASTPGATFGAVLGSRVPRWVGTRSYGIYLYHWPIFLVTRPYLDLPYGGWAAATTSLLLTGLVAEVSYRYLEMPIRRGALGRAWQAARGGSRRLRVGYGVAGLAAASTLAVGCSALAAVPTVDARTYLGGVTELGAGTLSARPSPTASGPSKTGAPSGNGSDPAKPDRVRPINLRTQHVTAVGDSVLLGARDALRRLIPRTTLDATISRQPYQLIDRVKERERVGRLASVLVIHTGTNGIPDVADLHDLLRSLSDLKRIVLVTVRSPVPWADASNHNIAEAAKGMSNVVVADWASASAGQRGDFYPDGTHLTPKGAALFARTIAEAIERPLPAGTGTGPQG
jgi:hypothetical protein